jgi:hypothetical protein
LSAWSRFSAAVTLLLHLILVGVGPVVDARLEVVALSSDHAPVHAEDAADPACGAGHHHHQLCLIRALQSMDAPAEGAPLQTALALSPPRPLPVSSGVPRSAAAFSALGPRAPPAA